MTTCAYEKAQTFEEYIPPRRAHSLPPSPCRICTLKQKRMMLFRGEDRCAAKSIFLLQHQCGGH